MSHTELVFTKPCIHCGQTGTVAVKFDQLLAYANGALIQDAFPDMPVPQREQSISGTHPECWQEMYYRPTQKSQQKTVTLKNSGQKASALKHAGTTKTTSKES